MKRISVPILSITVICSAVLADNGDPPAGDAAYPSWHERAALTVTNMVRVAPAEYRDAYLGDYQILLPANYPAVDPVYYDPDLHDASHDHSADMAANCGMQHSSCDGTAWDVRIKSYYTPGWPIGENIATGNEAPQATVKQWLMDYDTTRTIPAPDGHAGDAQFPSGDGHRSNIMGAGYTVLGNGYAYSSSRRWYHFWTQDFGGKTSPDASHPVASGSHLFLENGKTSFTAVYGGSGAPAAAQVIIDGAEQDLALLMGTESRGVWQYTGTAGSSCRRYRFIFTGAGGTEWLYPENGDLVTFGEGSCSETYRTPSPVAEAGRFPVLNPGQNIRVYTPDGRLLGIPGSGGSWKTAVPPGYRGTVLLHATGAGGRGTILKALYLQ